MAEPARTRFAATLALLRGIVLLLAGLFALFVPATALTVVVVVGGCLLVVDGVLGLATQDYGVEHAWPFWLALTRNVLAIVAGLVVLFSPWLVTMIDIGFLSGFVGLQAIVIGLIEIFVVIRDRQRHPTIWRAVAAGALYVALGLLLWFIHIAGAVFLVQVGGAILILFAALQLLQTWRTIRNAPGLRPLA